MLKWNGSRLVMIAVVAFGSLLGLGTAPLAQAQDTRIPVVRQREPHPEDLQRGPVMVNSMQARAVHIAQARGAAARRRSTAEQRSSAMERRDKTKPAQMRRETPTRERAEAERGVNGTRRSR